MDIRKVRGKRGQLTIFIILALVIVAALLIFLYFRSKVPGAEITPESFENPQQYIAECAEDAAKQAINTMLPQGGLIQPKNYVTYSRTRIELLCYTNRFYESCMNQYPLYIKHLEDEIKNEIEPKIEECFIKLKNEYEKKSLSPYVSSSMKVDVSVIDKKVNIDISRELSYTDKESTKSFKEFKSSFNSPLHRMARVAMEMISQEAQFCSAEHMGYMILYNDIKIEKIITSDQVKIYIITDKLTDKKLNIAIRGCVIGTGVPSV